MLKNRKILILAFFVICIFLIKKCKKLKENWGIHHWHPHIHLQKIFKKNPNVHHIHIKKLAIEKPEKNFVSKQISNKLSNKSYLNSINHIGDFKQFKVFINNHNIDTLNRALSKINKKYHQKLFDNWIKFESFTSKVVKDMDSISKHVGDAFVKIGDKIADEELLALQSFLDPCFWALDFGCHLYVESAVASVEALLWENTAEDEAEFTTLVELIRLMIKDLSQEVAKVVCENLVSSLFVPLMSPIFILIIYSITKDREYAIGIGDYICNLFVTIMTNLITKGKTGITITFIIINFVAGFMCSGKWFGIEISSVINGFVPYAQIELRYLGLNCEKTKKEPSYNKNKYNNLKKENNKFVYIQKGGTCESHGLLPILNLETCKKAGEFKVGNNKYDSRMPKDGYQGNVGRPYGCSAHNLNDRLYMFNEGQGQCGEAHFGCLCLNKKLKKNTVNVKKGRNCEESGYRTITDANKCFFALKNAGFYGYNVHQPRTLTNKKTNYLPIMDEGDDAPYGCTVDTRLNGEWSKNRGKFYQNKTGECGKNGKICLCSNSSYSKFSNLDMKLENTKDLKTISNPLNIIAYSDNFAIASNIDCIKNNINNTSSEAMCKKAAKEFGIKFGGIDKTTKYKGTKPKCGYDKIRNQIKFYKNGLNCNNKDKINCICSKKILEQKNYMIAEEKSCNDLNMKNTVTDCKSVASEIGKKYLGEDGTRKYKDTPKCGYDQVLDGVKFYNKGLDCNNKDRVSCICSKKISEQKNYMIAEEKSCNDLNMKNTITNCKSVASEIGKKYFGDDGTRKYKDTPKCGYDQVLDGVKFYKNGLTCDNKDKVSCICKNKNIK